MVTETELKHIEEVYSESYWHGGVKGPHGGYGAANNGVGYKDNGVYDHKVKKILEYQPKTVLEVACAYGFGVEKLRNAGIEAYGVDVSEFAISQANPTIKPYLQKAFAHKLPFPDKSFDVLACFGMMEHLSPELVEETIKEFARVANKVLLSITLATDIIDGHDDAEHPSIHDYTWWRERLPANFDLFSDSMETWQSYYSGNAVVVAPTIYPVRNVGYGGIERLCYLFSRGLADRGYQTTLIAARGSKPPFKVSLYDAGPATPDFREPNLNGTTISWFCKYMSSPVNNKPGERRAFITLDFSHSRPMQYNWQLPSITPIWHDPAMMSPKVNKYNIVALSKWQQDRFTKFAHQNSIILDPICVDSDLFKPNPSVQRENDRFIFIGKMHQTKNPLGAIQLAKKAGVRLDLISDFTPGDPEDYRDAILKEVDNDQITLYQNMSEESKIYLINRAQAVIYPVNYPEGQGESHSHKGVEALLCGTSMVTYNQGAMNEVIREGVTGYVANSEAEFLEYMKKARDINSEKCRLEALKRWSLPAVMGRWMPVIRDTARGLRW